MGLGSGLKKVEAGVAGIAPELLERGRTEDGCWAEDCDPVSVKTKAPTSKMHKICIFFMEIVRWNGPTPCQALLSEFYSDKAQKGKL